MHTRILMSASALFMGALGLTASFLSHELLVFAGATVDTQSVLIVQIGGALYLGFAMLNWYTRGFTIGGIYGRPLLIGNLLHFAVAAIPIVKAAVGTGSLALILLAAGYGLFAVWFGLVTFRPPAES